VGFFHYYYWKFTEEIALKEDCERKPTEFFASRVEKLRGFYMYFSLSTQDLCPTVHGFLWELF